MANYYLFLTVGKISALRSSVPGNFSLSQSRSDFPASEFFVLEKLDTRPLSSPMPSPMARVLQVSRTTASNLDFSLSAKMPE